MSYGTKAPATRWANAISNLLNDPTVAKTCREIAARMSSEELGGEQIGNVIEELRQTNTIRRFGTRNV